LAIGLALASGTTSADFPASFPLSSLDGVNGTVLPGVTEGDEAGRSIAYAGDINGDGLDDLVIGAPYASVNGAASGRIYVVFGSDQAFSTPLNLAALDGSNGFAINGEDIFDFAGISVAAAGDINGDGIDDLAIGASGVSSGANYSGSTYVVFGKNQPWPAAVELSALDGGNGFEIQGGSPYGESGAAVAAAGDINGDGIDDLLIGAPFAAGFNGRGYVVFGSDETWAANISLADLDGTNGFAMDAVNTGDTLGSAVSGAGDVNGDGFDDLVIGATLAGTAGAYSGAAYVVFGKNQAWTGAINLGNLNGSNGFAIRGLSQGDELGQSLGGDFDLNGDGVSDVVAGAPGADPGGDGSGAAYVVFGKNQTWPATLAVSSLNGSNGFAINGAGSGDGAGTAVAAAGDVSRDGRDDLILGAPMANPNGADSGSAYVVFGHTQAWTATLSLVSLNGSNGFRIDGVAADDQAGLAAAAAGDINSDTFDDLLVGAPQADTGGSNSGNGYLIFDAGEVVNEDIIFADGFEE